MGKNYRNKLEAQNIREGQRLTDFWGQLIKNMQIQSMQSFCYQLLS